MAYAYSLQKVKNILGAIVRNSANEEVGNIAELMVDPLNGHIIYVVIANGGILGIGKDYYTVTWKAISYDVEKNCYIINLEKDELEENVTSVDNKWSAPADPAWNDI